MSRRIESLLVTPEIARAMLSHRKPGQLRRFDRNHANVLKDRIAKDGYKECNDLWSIDIDGALINGQHRASAVAELGITVRQSVIFDASREEFAMIDSHKVRTMQVHFSVAGIANHKMAATSMAASVEFVHNRFHAGDSTFLRKRLSQLQMIAAYQESGFLQSCVSSMVAAKKRELLKGYGGFYKAVFSSASEVLWDEFFGKLSGDIPTTKKDIEFLLRNRLLMKGTDKLHQVQRAALIVIAWNCRISGRQMKVLSWDQEKQGFPSIEGTTPAEFASKAKLPVVQDWFRQK